MPIRPENKARYPTNWKKIREEILKRAKNKCEGCGVGNYEIVERRKSPFHPIKKVKIVLTIAHLDHIPENCDLGNLRAWCQKCHNGYDAKARAEGRKKRRKIEKAKEVFYSRETVDMPLEVFE